jgi:hypothetical protein
MVPFLACTSSLTFLIALNMICSTVENIAKTRIIAKAGKVQHDAELAASPDRGNVKTFEWQDPQG